MSLHIDAQATSEELQMRPLINAIGRMFASGCEMPIRHRLTFAIPEEEPGALFLTSAWKAGDDLRVKMINVVLGNAEPAFPQSRQCTSFLPPLTG